MNKSIVSQVEVPETGTTWLFITVVYIRLGLGVIYYYIYI